MLCPLTELSDNFAFRSRVKMTISVVGTVWTRKARSMTMTAIVTWRPEELITRVAVDSRRRS